MELRRKRQVSVDGCTRGAVRSQRIRGKEFLVLGSLPPFFNVGTMRISSKASYQQGERYRSSPGA